MDVVNPYYIHTAHIYTLCFYCVLICTLCFRMCFFNGCKVSSSSNVALTQYAISDTASFKLNLKQGKREKKKNTLTWPAAPKTKLYMLVTDASA